MDICDSNSNSDSRKRTLSWRKNTAASQDGSDPVRNNVPSSKASAEGRSKRIRKRPLRFASGTDDCFGEDVASLNAAQVLTETISDPKDSSVKPKQRRLRLKISEENKPTAPVGSIPSTIKNLVPLAKKGNSPFAKKGTSPLLPKKGTPPLAKKETSSLAKKGSSSSSYKPLHKPGSPNYIAFRTICAVCQSPFLKRLKNKKNHVSTYTCDSCLLKFSQLTPAKKSACTACLVCGREEVGAKGLCSGCVDRTVESATDDPLDTPAGEEGEHVLLAIVTDSGELIAVEAVVNGKEGAEEETRTVAPTSEDLPEVKVEEREDVLSVKVEKEEEVEVKKEEEDRTWEPEVCVKVEEAEVKNLKVAIESETSEMSTSSQERLSPKVTWFQAPNMDDTSKKEGVEDSSERTKLPALGLDSDTFGTPDPEMYLDELEAVTFHSQRKRQRLRCRICQRTFHSYGGENICDICQTISSFTGNSKKTNSANFSSSPKLVELNKVQTPTCVHCTKLLGCEDSASNACEECFQAHMESSVTESVDLNVLQSAIGSVNLGNFLITSEENVELQCESELDTAQRKQRTKIKKSKRMDGEGVRKRLNCERCGRRFFTMLDGDSPVQTTCDICKSLHRIPVTPAMSSQSNISLITCQNCFQTLDCKVTSSDTFCESCQQLMVLPANEKRIALDENKELLRSTKYSDGEMLEHKNKLLSIPPKAGKVKCELCGRNFVRGKKVFKDIVICDICKVLEDHKSSVAPSPSVKKENIVVVCP
ncbi:unnamed protein product [Cyprideis torosa]|uniref:Uncharacterized protein n=1 Tax=Cyprideis torosa TaxID=163714 RepID=A0A7R8W7T7_9CRUS|nr:unnamed protein product [Cyprideis torosa]CAG0883034.1 unnamed protein product [Cyprideis torosa]